MCFAPNLQVFNLNVRRQQLEANRILQNQTWKAQFINFSDMEIFLGERGGERGRRRTKGGGGEEGGRVWMCIAGIWCQEDLYDYHFHSQCSSVEMGCL